MLCVILDAKGNCNFVHGIAQIYVKNSDFDLICRNIDLRISVFNAAKSAGLITGDKLLIAALGKKDSDEIFEDYDIEQLNNMEYMTRKEFGVYEKF